MLPPSLFQCRATEITLIVVGLLLSAGAAIAYFQCVGTIATVALAIGSSACILGGIITIALHACKRPISLPSESASIAKEDKVVPVISKGKISPLERYQRQLLIKPSNGAAMVVFSIELMKIVGQLNDEDQIRAKIRPYIKFFDFSLIAKIEAEVTKNRSAPPMLILYLGRYKEDTRDLLIKRSNSSLQEIKRHIGAGEYLGTTSDNGDCFYEAVAQGLTQVCSEKVTKKELRQEVFTYVQKHKTDEWLTMALKNADSDYAEAVQWTSEECEVNKRSPVWGVDEIDLRILSDQYQVRFICNDAQWDDVSDDLLTSEPREIESLSGNRYERVVKIAYSEHHCIPILGGKGKGKGLI